jgi:hypothetical protein
MQTAQGNMLLSLQNVKGFTTENAAALGDVVTPQALTMLSDSITELSGHVAVQNGETRAAKSAIARRESLRTALIRDHMAPIAKIARLELRDNPELVSFGLPQDHPTTELLAALAYGMAQHADTCAAVFTNAGLKPDFTASLRAAADAMVQALNDRTASKARIKNATSALRNKLSRGRRVVHVLDAMIKSALVGDPDLLEAWKLVKRVPKTTGGRAASAKPATPEPTPVTAAA